MTQFEISINFLKEKLSLVGDEWKNGQDKEKMRDSLALVEAINLLEERVYGKRITDITYVL